MIDLRYSVWLLLNVVVFLTCLQQKFLYLTKHGVDLPCMLFRDLLFTFLFSMNLVPVMSLRFFFLWKAKIGRFSKFQLDLGLYAEDANVS